jgi:hypothetical protein
MGNQSLGGKKIGKALKRMHMHEMVHLEASNLYSKGSQNHSMKGTSAILIWKRKYVGGGVKHLEVLIWKTYDLVYLWE